MSRDRIKSTMCMSVDGEGSENVKKHRMRGRKGFEG